MRGVALNRLEQPCAGVLQRRRQRAISTPTAERAAPRLKTSSSVTRQPPPATASETRMARFAGQVARQHQPDQRHHEQRRDAEHPIHEHRRDRVAAAHVEPREL